MRVIILELIELQAKDKNNKENPQTAYYPPKYKQTPNTKKKPKKQKQAPE